MSSITPKPKAPAVAEALSLHNIPFFYSQKACSKSRPFVFGLIWQKQAKNDFDFVFNLTKRFERRGNPLWLPIAVPPAFGQPQGIAPTWSFLAYFRQKRLKTTIFTSLHLHIFKSAQFQISQ
ncbi:hypothetical protein [Nibribacter koreensis]|uniref:hypothetical protein n=1 Tax=Nibribacter koreensis TaxID=1084519 RepID=UPI0031EBF9B7